jgi:hypothetical protein
VPVVTVEAFEISSRSGIRDCGNEFLELRGRGLNAGAVVAGINFDEDTDLNTGCFDGCLELGECI